VLRSANPSHPILAFGPQASWITSNHEQAPFPCGPGTPFEKALQLDAKALFFDVPFRSLTFFHYVEHVFQDLLPTSLYDPDPVECKMRSLDGSMSTVNMRVFSAAIRRARESDTLEHELTQQGFLKRKRLGNSTLLVVGLQQVMDSARGMAAAGRPLYACPEESAASAASS
jgi:aminoglycoside N3'-acetyltransferase